MTTEYKSTMVFIIIGLIAISYFNALSATFVLDDKIVVTNEFIGKIGLKGVLTDCAEQICTGNIKNGILYRPVLMLSFFLDHIIWQENCFGYHLTNILLHIVNCVLLFLLLNLLFKSRGISFIATALFSIYPIQVEAVTWVSGRNDILLSIFFLLSLFLYVRKKILFAYFAFLLALFTKESSILLLPIFVVYDAIFKQKPKQQLLNYLGFLTPIFIYLCTRYLVICYKTGNRIFPADMFGSIVLKDILNIPLYYLNYLKLLLYPKGYSFKPVFLFNTNIMFGHVISVAMIAIFLFILFLSRKSQQLTFALSWFFITLLPTCGIVPMPWPLMEHRLYLASIGFFVFISYYIYQIVASTNKTYKMLGVLFLATILIWSSAITHYRNELFVSETRLEESYVQYNKSAIEAQINLINEYIATGRCEEAVNLLEELVKVAPQYNYLLYFERGYVYINNGDTDQALSAFDEAIKFSPKCIEAYNNKAAIYFYKHQYNKSWEEVHKIEALGGAVDPEFIKNLGKASGREK